jgi:iron complex outermembrane receptor protein
MTLFRISIAFSFLIAAAAQAAPEAAVSADSSGGIVTLEEFITRETALVAGDSLDPRARPVDDLYGSARPVAEVPRSVTLLNPETMKLRGVRDFADLAAVSAGAQRVNYYGVPGAPQFRGDLASVYFDGMERAYQRNEMPTSFGSLEALDLVRGPAPAHFGPTQAGGFVNMVPKPPYFDRTRGSVRLTVGTCDYYNAQIDVGGPREMLGRPAAYRLSVTGQKSGSWYDDVRNDYLSAYGAAKMDLARGRTLFTGFEAYVFRSNENAGWNRVTQDLIDHGLYLAGEVPDLVDHPANRSDDGLSKGITPFVVVPATPGREPTVFSAAGGNPAAIIPPEAFRAGLAPELRALLGPEGQYTAAYLNAGGPLHTVHIDGSTVLADPRDHADAESLLAFCDYVRDDGDGLRVKNQFLVDALRTDKLSSYGYAFANDQILVEDKITLEHPVRLGRESRLIWGGEAKHHRAKQLQDFDDEPFSRRDISNPVVTRNSVVLTGGQRDETGLNHWSRLNGSVESHLTRLGLFAVLDTRWTQAFSTVLSLRGETAGYRIRRPVEVDRRADRGQLLGSGTKNFANASLSPVLDLGGGVKAYGAVQVGATAVPTQGGVIDRGRGNFADSELYEAGLKGEFFGGRVFATLAGYYWDKARYDLRSGVLNPLRGKGLELEVSYVAEEGFSLVANATVARAYLRGWPAYRFQATQDYYMPLVAGGLFTGGGGANALVRANNPERIVPGTPDAVVNLFASWQGKSGFGVAAGPTWRSACWHNFDHTLRLPSSFVLGASAWWRGARTEVLLQLTNVLSEDWFTGSDPFFAANTVITKAPPIEGKLTITRKF